MVERSDTLAAIFHQTPDIVVRHIAGEILLIPVKGKVADMQRVFVLNPIGERIWQGIAEERPFAEIVDGIVASYEVTKETAASDALDFLTELLEAGLATR